MNIPSQSLALVCSIIFAIPLGPLCDRKLIMRLNCILVYCGGIFIWNQVLLLIMVHVNKCYCQTVIKSNFWYLSVSRHYTFVKIYICNVNFYEFRLSFSDKPHRLKIFYYRVFTCQISGMSTYVTTTIHQCHITHMFQENTFISGLSCRTTLQINIAILYAQYMGARRRYLAHGWVITLHRIVSDIIT